MRKLLLSICAVLCLGIAVSAQSEIQYPRYEGNVSVGLQFIGFNASLSNGVNFGKDYVGIGLDLGAATLMALATRSWNAIYPEYRHDFRIGKSSSFFLSAGTGIAYSNSWDLTDLVGKTQEEKDSMQKVYTPLSYSKLGLGFKWSIYKSLGVAFGVNCSIFAPTDIYRFAPSVNLTIYW